MRLSHFNLHHIHPRSCGGSTHEFNLFPYEISAHCDWHRLFANMPLIDVWRRAEEIHKVIFYNEAETLTRYWLSDCRLSRKDLETVLRKEYRMIDLQDFWISAFGSSELVRARMVMKKIMLFMILGCEMARLDEVFQNHRLEAFFKKFPLEKERAWAFDACFGRNAGWHRIRCMTIKILKRTRN